MKKLFLLALTCLGLSAASSIASASTILVERGCCPKMVVASCGSCCYRPTCYRSCYRPCCRVRCCNPRPCCNPCRPRCCGGMW